MEKQLNNKQIMSQNLKYYLAKHGKSQKEIAEIIDVSTGALNDWVQGRTYPRIDKIEKLAEYFGILKSDLVEEKSEERENMQKNNDIIVNVVLRMRRDADFLCVVKMIDNLDEEKYDSIKSLLAAFATTGK